MDWKKKFENSIEEEAFIRSFKSNKDVLDYLENYFKNFFNVQAGLEFIKVTRTLINKFETVKIEIFDRQLSASETGTNISFVALENDKKVMSLGMLFRDQDMRLYDCELGKDVTFNNNTIDRFIEIAFNPNVSPIKKPLQI